MNTQVYQRITDRIITLLSQGTVPWQKPWKASTSLPRNLVTRKTYRGINVFMLLSMNYDSPFWLTFRQATASGGTVRKGEKAFPVVFWKPFKVKDKDSGEERKIPLLRFYHVFNASQCDGLKDTPVVSGTTTKPAEIVANMPQRPAIKHGMTRACYSLAEDLVGMPAQERFSREEDYYSTLFHELVHSTGHESRLKRPTLLQNGGFGTDPYCKEELVAEMGAAFLCAQAEIVERTIDNSAAYVNCWLEQLKQDATLVVQAAAQAQRAVDFVLSSTAETGAGKQGGVRLAESTEVPT